MENQNTRITVIIIIALLASSLVYLSIECFLISTEAKSIKNTLKIQQSNEKAQFFAKLFIDKILLSSGTVNFEDRLRLENAVRDIGDPEIMNQWQSFTNSKSDQETQKTVGSMLRLLVDKIGNAKNPVVVK